MAFTVTDEADATSASSTASLATSGVVDAAVGDWLVVIAGSDNNGTAGISSTTTVQDSGSNSWSERIHSNRTGAGAPGDGATLKVWTSEITNALSGGTVTVNYSPNTTAKAIQVYRVQVSGGNTIGFIAADATGSTGNVTTHSAATISVADTRLIFGMVAMETGSGDPPVGDGDTTNGNWSTIKNIVTGAGAGGNVANGSQYKVVNATGNQDWACTTTSNRDSARSYLVLEEIAAGGGQPTRNRWGQVPGMGRSFAPLG